MKKKTGIFLINLGTPDSPSVSDVRKYLREFLMDRRVIDIPPVNRYMLINFIIAPFRAPKSAKVYQELWEEKGSPLMFYGAQLKDLLQQALGKDYQVELGMRYQNPSLASTLKAFEGKGIDKLIVAPLFPQYASATTGSAYEETMRIVSKWEIIPEIKFMGAYADHPLFIKSFAEIGKKYLEEDQYDHYLFTYHGLPERQITKSSIDNYCQLSEKCCSKYHSKNRYCYRAQCFETTRQLVGNLGIEKDKYTIAFQSRLGKTPWIKPYSDDIIIELANKGVKKILAFSPSFVADCLETTIEIGEEYKELFQEHGGEKLQLVESLNVHPVWVDSLKEMILEQ
ncbi:ferrochelatase [Cytophagaceae bacterium ABcell3]|nr:ferrochelatase [Cytophagaceae bacterium ABcell3]